MHGLILKSKTDDVKQKTVPGGKVISGTIHAGDFGGHWFSKSDLVITITLTADAEVVSAEPDLASELRLHRRSCRVVLVEVALDDLQVPRVRPEEEIWNGSYERNEPEQEINSDIPRHPAHLPL